MKHKKLIIVIVVLVVMAIAASVAYAWWSDTVSTEDNSVSTGGVALETFGLPITADGLAPQNAPAMDAADGAYASVSYFWVKNADSIPLMFYGWLSDGSDPNNINPYVHIRIWLLGSTAAPAYWTGFPAGWVDTFQVPGPHLSYDGTLAGLWTDPQPQGRNYLSSRWWGSSTWHHTLINGGEYGVYRAAVWLDGSAPDSTQHSTVSFTINFTGMQEEAWNAAGYDSIPKF